jgi:photosystem II stability/assembly factor-like uncharacterized protein/molybdopterin converting factor small subunit
MEAFQMVHVILPSYLAARVDRKSTFEVEGATAGEALRRLETGNPPLMGWILDEAGRLRRHVQVFRGSELVGLDAPVAADDRLHVVAAISGGTDDSIELLVGTKKGLFILRGRRGEPLEVVGRKFPGEVCEYAMVDPRTGRYFASVTHGQFGCHLFWTDGDPLGEWQEAQGPAFPEGEETSMERVWVVETGEAEGELWAGVAPAALFHSTDGGASWELVRGLWDLPEREKWGEGAGGQCLHSICPYPEDPKRLSVGISAAGAWHTEDGGETWTRGIEGLVPYYIPEEARPETYFHCIHKMVRSALEPETLYLQFHRGVYRSDDGGKTWDDIREGLPADFGFPMIVDPRDPDRAFVIPLVSDYDRVTPEGKVRVYETRDRGKSWIGHGNGLPQDESYLTVLRQAFCHDGRDPLGLYFGAESGEVFASADGGETWVTAQEHLAPVASVRVGRV